MPIAVFTVVSEAANAAACCFIDALLFALVAPDVATKELLLGYDRRLTLLLITLADGFL